MLWTRRLIGATVVTLALLALVLVGCEKDMGELKPNLAPETTLSFSPEQGDTSNYRVRMNWFGWDPDGDVEYFLTKWDTMDWRKVISTDSVFFVSAAAGGITDQFGYEYHSFRVKAVDNEGLEDATPESVAFTAFTFVPETAFLQVGGGPTGVTGPKVTFRWQATDQDGVIEYYDYHLEEWNSTAEEWEQVIPPQAEGEWVRVGSDTTTWSNEVPLDGRHRFQVRAIDDAGAIDQTPASRVFTSVFGLAGPRLYIRCNVFDIENSPFRGPVWPDDANDAIPIFAGERLRFDWVADAQDYGGQVVGYRHAWDDTSTWPQWSVFDTRFEVAPTPGGHNLYVSALDNSNVQTRARIRLDVVEASLDEYILVVDDWDWRENFPEQAGWGTDEQRTGFYDELLAGYVRDRVEWDAALEDYQPPDVTTLRGASTVVWYCDGQAGWQGDPMLKALFQVGGGAQYNTLAGYVRVGGNLLLCGRGNMAIILDDTTYPLTVSATDSTQSQEFVREFLHIGYTDNSGSNQNASAPWNYGLVFHGANPSPAWEDEFSPVYLDSVGPEGYPDEGKWPLYVSPANPNLDRCGIDGVESVYSFQATGEEFLLMDSHLNPNFEGESCGVLYLSGDNHGNSCYLGFPLYYCQYEHVQLFMDKLMELFGEEKIQTP
ncbi:MAG: hypothetical protein GF400_07845 [Candidatus Eisenbacteria bacterium]|nr:hypothetical protein [Candidatus Eisenbacteria bacterium]